ncbi:hypothetical protein H4Q26_011554 [Puccinia striiformis f. sp. tritici PST-130]|nr:hypothetical protein H4Q26_011554 [Puccinia striiformis f. sp. tritici PST-130]
MNIQPNFNSHSHRKHTQNYLTLTTGSQSSKTNYFPKPKPVFLHAFITLKSEERLVYLFCSSLILAIEL